MCPYGDGKVRPFFFPGCWFSFLCETSVLDHLLDLNYLQTILMSTPVLTLCMKDKHFSQFSNSDVGLQRTGECLDDDD